jgi:hypothetical protein
MQTRKILAGARIVATAALSLACAGVVGCVGYRLGSTLPPGVKTVFIPTFQNTSGEPEAELFATRATIEEFQKDGSLDVASDPAGADVVVEATVVRVRMEPVRYNRDDPKTADEYRLFIEADVVLYRAAGKTVMFKKRLSGDRTFVPTGDLSSSKRTVLPEAAADLAHDIVEAVVEYW